MLSLFFAGPLHICLLPLQAPTVVPSSTGAGPSNQNDFTSDAEADSSEEASDASSSEALSEDMSSRLGSHAAAGPRKLGSIASTYWRPERQDRKENLSVIDERYTAFYKLISLVHIACSDTCNCMHQDEVLMHASAGVASQQAAQLLYSLGSSLRFHTTRYNLLSAVAMTKSSVSSKILRHLVLQI